VYLLFFSLSLCPSVLLAVYLSFCLFLVNHPLNTDLLLNNRKTDLANEIFRVFIWISKDDSKHFLEFFQLYQTNLFYLNFI
jgi:hypothetical protein